MCTPSTVLVIVPENRYFINHSPTRIVLFDQSHIFTVSRLGVENAVLVSYISL